MVNQPRSRRRQCPAGGVGNGTVAAGGGDDTVGGGGGDVDAGADAR